METLDECNGWCEDVFWYEYDVCEHEFWIEGVCIMWEISGMRLSNKD